MRVLKLGLCQNNLLERKWNQKNWYSGIKIEVHCIFYKLER